MSFPLEPTSHPCRLDRVKADIGGHIQTAKMKWGGHFASELTWRGESWSQLCAPAFLASRFGERDVCLDIFVTAICNAHACAQKTTEAVPGSWNKMVPLHAMFCNGVGKVGGGILYGVPSLVLIPVCSPSRTCPTCPSSCPSNRKALLVVFSGKRVSVFERGF